MVSPSAAPGRSDPADGGPIDVSQRIAGRCAVVRDVIGLQQVRLGAKQQNAATRVVRDVVLSHDDLRRGTAARESVATQCDSIP